MENTSDLLISKFNSDIENIENELAEIISLASEMSEKFAGISNEIKEISGTIGKVFGKNAGALTYIAGGAVKFFGEIYADVKKEEALMKILPKKKILATEKLEIVKFVLGFFLDKIKKEELILLSEINREISDDNYDEFVELYSVNCMRAFDLYLHTLKLIQVCEFAINEFEAWLNNEHNSKLPKITNVEIYAEVVSNFILPSGVETEIVKDKFSASFWILSQKPDLLGAYYYNVFNNSSSLNVIRVFKKPSFMNLRKVSLQFEKLSKNKNSKTVSWINQNPFFIKGKSILKISSLNSFLFKNIIIGNSLFFVLLHYYSDVQKGILEIILSSILFASIVSIFIFLFSKLLFSIYENDKKSLSYYLLLAVFTFFTLGFLPYAFKRYLKKEMDYKVFIEELKLIK